MKIPGKRITVPRWVHTNRCVVCVQVEAVIPDADPSEPCLESETIRWLSEIRQRAEAGDLAWLGRVGEVYVKQAA